MKWIWYIRGLGLAALMLCSACGGKPDSSLQQAPPTAVNLYTVKEGSSQYFDLYPATTSALNQVDVRSNVAGYISGIYFTEGQVVRKGEKLYSIDAQQYRGAYEQAVAGLRVAEANQIKAQQDADRYEELSRQDAVARQTLDHAVADLEAAKKQVEAAKANVSAVETNLRYTTINAPFSGTIGISAVKLGASVTPGQTILNTISSDDPMAVDIAADQKQIPQFIQFEQSKSSKGQDSTFTLMLADRSIYPYYGKMFLIDRAVDPQTGTIKARFLFANSQRQLKPGMNVNLRVKNYLPAKSILIPFRAVVEQMGEYFVFVVKDNKASIHKVTLGNRIRDLVLVQQGIQANDEIVIDGVQKLRDGATVTSNPAKQGG
ncbi:MAG: efflux RND transporter periplasmic adaptor subunit [Chitinophagales bacterium]